MYANLKNVLSQKKNFEPMLKKMSLCILKSNVNKQYFRNGVKYMNNT